MRKQHHNRRRGSLFAPFIVAFYAFLAWALYRRFAVEGNEPAEAI